MSDQPSTLLDWVPGETDVAIVDAPSALKRATGFAESERPPVQEVNAMFQNLFDWVAWLRAKTTGQQVATATATVLATVRTFISNGAGTVVATLFSPTSRDGQRITLINIHATGGLEVRTPSAGATINGVNFSVSGMLLTEQYERVTLEIYDGKFYIVEKG